MRLEVVTKSGRAVCTLSVNASSSVESLKNEFRKQRNVGAERQRFVVQNTKVPLVDGKVLNDYSLKDGDKLVFKNLGPQIGYQTVFIIEYLGPMLLYPLVYLRPGALYSESGEFQWVQTWAAVAWFLHYLKREYETVFVHRFSHGTMPIFNLFKNSSYYWGFCVFVAYFINHPLYTPPTNLNQIYAGFALFALAEVMNLHCHIILMNLRPPGTKERNIPRGNMFEFVSCANYFWEITAWLGFNIATQSVAGYLFMFAGAYQMLIWAGGKHRNYRKQFDGKDGRKLYPRNRKALIPFLM